MYELREQYELALIEKLLLLHHLVDARRHLLRPLRLIAG